MYLSEFDVNLHLLFEFTISAISKVSLLPNMMGYFILLFTGLILFAIGNTVYWKYKFYKYNSFKTKIVNLFSFCKKLGFEECDESDICHISVCFRRSIDKQRLDDIERIINKKIVIPQSCHLYEYLLISNQELCLRKDGLTVKCVGGTELYHGFHIKIDGLWHSFWGDLSLITQIALHQEFSEGEYYLLYRRAIEKAYSYLFDHVYRNAMIDYKHFMKYKTLCQLGEATAGSDYLAKMRHYEYELKQLQTEQILNYPE